MSLNLATAAPARRRFLRRSGQRVLRHLLLALSLVVVALSVVGMHQMAVRHDVATGQPSISAHAGPLAHLADAADSMHVDPGHHAELTAGSTTGGADPGCPDCGDHQMALGSCLLALTLLVLTWMLAPPRLRHLPPFLLPRRAVTAVGLALGRLVPPLSLTELCLRRT